MVYLSIIFLVNMNPESLYMVSGTVVMGFHGALNCMILIINLECIH